MASDSRSDPEMHPSSLAYFLASNHSPIATATNSIPSQHPAPTGPMQSNENGSPSSINPSTHANYTMSTNRADADAAMYRSPYNAPTGVSYPGIPSYYPPPPPYDNPIYDTPSRRRKCRGICLCRIITILILVTILCSILSFTLDVIFRPKHPFVSVASASVFSFSINHTSRTISSDFSVTFYVHNPNRHMDISYHDISAGVAYGVEFIAVRPQVVFFQAARAKTTKGVRIIEVDAPVGTSTIKGIDDDIANGGVVEFGVKLDALMKFSKIMWFKKTLVVSCPDVKIQLVNGTATRGFMLGPPVICNVSE